MTVRDRIADALDRLAVAVWSLANRLRPVYKGPLCPDCQIEPDLGPDVECPLCLAKWEAHQLDKAMHCNTGGW